MNRKKRFMDLFISISILLLLLPIFLIIALMIWIEDGGPIFFQQKRLGIKGRTFIIYKFRKFANNKHIGGPKITFNNDKRFSLVGRILDRAKLNELPQLVNVIKGEMSLVGPRPEITEYQRCYKGGFRKLLNIYPGIFGPSQSIYRNEASLYPNDCDPEEFYANFLFPAKAKIDLKYYPTATVLIDIYWIFKSLISVVFFFGPKDKNELGDLLEQANE